MQARMPRTTSSRLPLCAITLLAGADVLLSLPALDTAWFLLAALPALLLLLIVKKWRLAVVFFLAGFAWSGLFTGQQLATSLPLTAAGRVITVDGHIEGLPEKEGRVVRFNLYVFRSDQVDGKQVKGRIRVSDYRRQSIDPQPGEAWRLLLRVKPAHGFANPAGFDYEKWLFNQRVVATAYIRNSKTDRATDAQVNHRLPELDQTAIIDHLRLQLARQIKKNLSDSGFSGIITALATGDRRAISSQQWAVLQKTGTSHLMAISGLHVGLVAGIAFFLFRLLWSRVPGLPLRYPAYKAAALAALLFAFFYSLMAGFSLPTQRALLMLTLLSITIVSDRRVRPLDILSLTLIVVLIFDPLSILSAGFWLSFCAVAIILYALLHRKPEHSWQWNSVSKAMRLQWKLSLMMAPVTLLFFQQIPVAGPVANLVAIPVVAFLIVPLVLIASLLFLIFGSGYLEQQLFQLADFVLQRLWSFLDSLAATAETLPFSPSYSIAAVTGVFFTMLIMMLPSGLNSRKLVLVGLLACLFPSQNDIRQGEFSVILLDVGQGLSAIIRTERHTLLFDAGARFSKHFNAGDAVVVPVLKSLSVDKLDTLIISHGDNDHRGGAAAILTAMDVKQVLSNEKITAGNVGACLAGKQWQWDGVSFTILHPAESIRVAGNNTSCVLHVRSPYGSILLPADIEKEAENEIVSRYSAALHSNILVAPHHGSKTSSSEDFIDAVAPELVLFPAGWMNRYQHPAKLVMQRLAERGIESRVTGDCGAIIVRAQQRGISVESWRLSNRKLWDRTNTAVKCRKLVLGLPENPAL
jgi:competence protein ComEC